MDIFDILTLAGGLSLFLFGMSIMGQALERRAGDKLRSLLGRFTTNRTAGLLTGLGITAVIQSSSATTVMVVGFVNSGLMTLKQAINVIMGANIGTTVTAWVLSLAGIDSGNIIVRLLKPSSFTPVLALVGIVFYMFSKNTRKKDTGMILLGFATLMFGMEEMSGAVSGLRDVPGFQNLLVMFTNPVFGVLAGTILTAVIQSSSASVGILQALAVTGKVTYGMAVPIIMGQNIGTCVTAMLSSVGASKNGKRAAMVHLLFNVIGTAVWLTVFCLVKLLFAPAFLEESASLLGIAVAHSVFNVLCTALILPVAGVLEGLVRRIVPDAVHPEVRPELDDRLLATPSIALERCHDVAVSMAELSVETLKAGMDALDGYTPDLAADVREKEEKTDYYEDILGTFLVKLSARQISEADSAEAARLLKLIGDFERISDHGVNLLEAAEEMRGKGLEFTGAAAIELETITSAVREILDLSLGAFKENDQKAASMVEPLEQVIDQLKEQMRTRHILRLQQGLCSMDAGFIWSDLLTSLERASDHCSNIAGCVINMADYSMNLHESLRTVRNDSEQFRQSFQAYAGKYSLVRQQGQAVGTV
ncbi:MAG: Na/Pi cotransporter family protein [Lachnospiraceae bacterium]|nr:Na/Pi cotransporter family protein [Lachnospiraceae bacterium]